MNYLFVHQNFPGQYLHLARALAADPRNRVVLKELANHVGLPAQYHGNDVMDGGMGDDYIEGNGRDDDVYGGGGADRLLGDDKITPGAYHGNDYLDGGSGADTLEGER